MNLQFSQFPKVRFRMTTIGEEVCSVGHVCTTMNEACNWTTNNKKSLSGIPEKGKNSLLRTPEEGKKILESGSPTFLARQTHIIVAECTEETINYLNKILLFR